MKKSEELALKLKPQFKKLLAFELLLHNLLLLVLLPGPEGATEESQQDIDEMKTVFQKLKVSEGAATSDKSSGSAKRQKKDQGSKGNEE